MYFKCVCAAETMCWFNRRGSESLGKSRRVSKQKIKTGLFSLLTVHHEG